jgi:hypothetical protein
VNLNVEYSGKRYNRTFDEVFVDGCFCVFAVNPDNSANDQSSAVRQRYGNVWVSGSDSAHLNLQNKLNCVGVCGLVAML